MTATRMEIPNESTTSGINAHRDARYIKVSVLVQKVFKHEWFSR